MSTPQDKRGLKAIAYTQIGSALKVLLQALQVLGAESPEGQDVLEATKKLGKVVAQKDNAELEDAEILQMNKGVQATPIQQALMRMKQQSPSQPAPAA